MKKERSLGRGRRRNVKRIKEERKKMGKMRRGKKGGKKKK